MTLPSSVKRMRQSPTRRRYTPFSPFKAFTLFANEAGLLAYWSSFERISFAVFVGMRPSVLSEALLNTICTALAYSDTLYSSNSKMLR